MTSIDHKAQDLEIIIIYLYVLLKNNVVIKMKAKENVRKAAKTM